MVKNVMHVNTNDASNNSTANSIHARVSIFFSLSLSLNNPSDPNLSFPHVFSFFQDGP